MEMPHNFLKYHSEPRSLFDYAGRIICEFPTRLATGESKPSFGWTWKKQPFPEDFNGAFISGDRNALTVRNYLQKVMALTRFGWQTIRVIHADTNQIEPERLQKLDYWKYAWAPEDHSFLDVCSTVINPKTRIKILNGDAFWVYGIGSDKKEVPLVVSNAYYRGSRNYKGLPLF
ncbi:MAG: hypothetical protein PHQ59_03820 [Candidatus Daviesbacteria bacterium]|nr:hypothetical protein [Candidatus Daviesbacteria bacterium]